MSRIKYFKVLFILFVLSGINITQAQITQEWFAAYSGPGNGPDEANSIEVDVLGNVYVTGGSIGNGTDKDFTTIKYNSSGVLQWVQRYNGPGNSLDEAYDIAVDQSGNVYVTGRSRAGSTEYTYDYATVKYNSSGEEQWVVRYNGTAGGSDEAYSIALDRLGNVYVTGQAGHSALNGNFATIKYNSSGVQQWAAVYDGPGSDWDRASSLAIDESFNVYVTGSQATLPGTAYHDYATIKYDSSGILQWIATYNGTANNTDYAVAIGLDASGNVYITGYSTGTVYDIVTIKYNPAGLQQWIRINSTGGSSVDVPTDMFVDASGELYITGAMTFNFGTIKYNSDGVQQWLSTYDASGNFDAANSIAVDRFGGVFVTGVSSAGLLENTQDYATIKYNSSGIQEWVQRHNGSGNDWDEATSIAVDNSGNVFVTGFSSANGSSDYGTIKYSQPVGVQPVSNEIPSESRLLENYPNPFNPSTVIHYQLAESGFTSIKVYDVLGNEVATLVSEDQHPGEYKAEWNAGNFSSGIYFCKFVTKDVIQTKKMNLIK